MNIDWLSLSAPLVSAVIGAVVGALVVHRAAVLRDSRNEQRSRRIEHLISAYRHLIAAANRGPGLSSGERDGLETAIGDVMLLGQRSEVEAARLFLVVFAEQGTADLDALLAALRTSLRHELQLDETPMPKPYNLRIR